MKPIRFLSAILFLLAAIACTQTPQPVAVVPSELPTAQPEAVTAEPTSEPTPEPVLLFNEAIPRDTQKLVLQMPIASFEAVEDALSVLPNVTDAEITFSEPWESDLNGLSAYLRFWHAHPLIRLTEIFPEGDVSFRELLRSAYIHDPCAAGHRPGKLFDIEILDCGAAGKQAEKSKCHNRFHIITVTLLQHRNRTRN